VSYTKTCSLRVFKNRVLRKICGPKRKEVTDDCSRLNEEELRGLYSPPNVVGVIKKSIIRLVSEKKSAYRLLLGKPEEKSKLGRSRLRWEDHIKTALQGAE
jgi:hypothetical protein